jgi:hypothetical protein
MSIGNTSLHQSGEIPEIVKLPNGRIRVTRRFHKFTREDIDNANLGSLMGDFGDLDTAGEQISNQGYTNCRLISVEVDPSFRFNSVSNTDSAVLVKTYETLTDSFVQITDDTVTFTENGLKQITRVYRAVSGTTSSNVVGVTALGTGEILASSRIEDNDAFAELTETYVEAGILSRTEDFVGSQDSLVIEAIGPDPSTPSGFSLASKQESNYEGLQTNRFTFLKNDVKLSASEDEIGSQNAITEEWFKPVEGRETKTNYSLARKEESDVGGIPTERYTFLKDNVVLSRTTDLVGSQNAITVEVFNPSEIPSPVSNFYYTQPDGTSLYLQPDDVSLYLQIEGEISHLLANVQESNVDGIPTKRYTFLKPSILSQSEDKVGSQLAITIEAFGEVPATPAGYSLARTDVSDFEGIETNRYTFLKPSILSQSEDKVGSQQAIVIEAFGEVPSTPSGYSLARTDVSDFEGIETNRYTFLKPSILSQSEDKVGSQRAIIIEAFDEVPSTPAGYSLARTDVSDFEGIKTNRYTFLKPSVLSRSIREQNNGALIIETVEAFNEIPTSDTGGVNIGEDVSNVEGIPTRRYTFAKGNGQIQVSKRPASPSLAGATEVTVVSYGTAVTPTGVLIAESETEEDGYVRHTKTALQGTITGVKQTYKDVVDVRVAGTVSLESVSKSVGGISGTIAVSKVTPPKTKQIAATVEVEITTTPPNTAALAYDLGDISCSVTAISMSENFRGTDTFTTSSGNTRFSGQRKTADMSARISAYPECYLSSGTSNSGTFSYVSSHENSSTSPNSLVTAAQTSTTNTFVDGTGSTSDTTTTTGIIKRTSRPILTTLLGVTYYEVITWSV